jgi:hypothetical protein
VAEVRRVFAKSVDAIKKETQITMVLVGVDERKTFARRALREVILPRSILSYVGREGSL